MKPARKTKSGAVDKRSETSARNVGKARDTIARYVSAGKQRMSEDEDEDLVIEVSSDESPPATRPIKRRQTETVPVPVLVPAQSEPPPWEVEIRNLRSELALFREQLQPPAKTPQEDHRNTVAAIRRSILLKF